jgi:hypothetical protein
MAYRAFRRHSAWLLLAVLAGLRLAMAGDAPEIAVDARASEVVIGEGLDYQVIVRNMQQPQRPDMSAFGQDFDVAAAGDQSINQQQISMVNGRMSQFVQFGHIFTYRLTPKRAGTLKIPGPFLLWNGRRIEGPEGTLRVIAPEKQDLVLMELAPGKRRVYATQPFDVNLRVLVKPLPGHDTDPLSQLEPPALQINWLTPPDGLAAASDFKDWLRSFITGTGHGFSLNKLTVGNNNPFSFFEQPSLAVLSLYTGRETRHGLDGRPYNYFVYELKRTFTAQKTGAYTFGPALLKGRFIDAINGRTATTRMLVVSTPPCTVEVREVPAPRPPTFCGGIGEYKARASANATALRVGDPLTLYLDIERGEGSGTLDLVSAPDLTANEQLAVDFNVIDKAPTGQTNGNVKRFAYDLRPKRAGAAIPALTITVFEPAGEKFVAIHTEPVALKVTEAAQLKANEVVAAASGARNQNLRSSALGVFENVAELSELQDQSVRPFNYVATVLALWLTYAGLSVLVTVRRRRAGDAFWQRRQRARKESRDALAEARAALARGQGAEAVKRMQQALTSLVANMLNLPAAGMTAAEAAQALAANGVSEGVRTETAQLLEALEAAQYGALARVEAAALIESSDSLLHKLHGELNAKRR